MWIEGREIPTGAVLSTPAHPCSLYYRPRVPHPTMPKVSTLESGLNGMIPHLSVSYSENTSQIVLERAKNPFRNKKDISIDYRFWDHFQLDFYSSRVLGHKVKQPPVVRMQYIDWRHMNKSEDLVIKRVVTDCEKLGLDTLMKFKYDWNTEVICQFFATYYFDGANDTIHWLTEGVCYKIDFVSFARLLALGAKDRASSKIHNEPHLSNQDLAHIYQDPEKADGSTLYLKPCYFILNNLFRTTLLPKKTDSTNLCSKSRNLLNRFSREYCSPFSVSDLIWSAIHRVSKDSMKNFPYAPYLMHVIEEVFGIKFPKDHVS